MKPIYYSLIMLYSFVATATIQVQQKISELQQKLETSKATILNGIATTEEKIAEYEKWLNSPTNRPLPPTPDEKKKPEQEKPAEPLKPVEQPQQDEAPSLSDQIKGGTKLKPVEKDKPRQKEETYEEAELRKRREAMSGDAEEEDEKEKVVMPEAEEIEPNPAAGTPPPPPPLVTKPEQKPKQEKPAEGTNDLLESIRKGKPLKKPTEPEKNKPKESPMDGGLVFLESFNRMDVPELKKELVKIEQELKDVRDKGQRGINMPVKRALNVRKAHIELLISLKSMTVDELKKRYRENSNALVREALSSKNEEKITALKNREELIEQIIKAKGGTVEEEKEETPEEWED